MKSLKIGEVLQTVDVPISKNDQICGGSFIIGCL